MVRSRLKRLGGVLERSRDVLVTSHNNPDPDSIVSALLFKSLLEHVFSLSPTLSYSGVVGRAENESLLDYSDASLVHHPEIDIEAFDSIVLVDTQPGTGNHPFDDEDRISVVLDHHKLRPETRRVAFFDVREHLGTTTTLAYLYCRAWGVPLTQKLSTLMLYALRSETADMGRDASPVDRRIFKELYTSADLRALSRIVNAKVDTDYFAAIHRAVGRAIVYGRLVVVGMGRLPYPDAAAQIADYFLKYRDADVTFTIGVFEDMIVMSLRSNDPASQLGVVARKVVRGLGTAGGHDSSAGGQVPIEGKTDDEIEALQDRLVFALLKELGLENTESRKLVDHIDD
jgi:nanoRNase/pAp phosphatase (c-di-AMP/oligoRNAs hydrolase)